MLKQYSRREKKKFKFVYLMLLFPIAHLLVFYVYLNVDSVLLAFQNGKGVFTLNNFKQIFRELQNKDGLSLGLSLKRSVITWFITHSIPFPISILFAYALFKRIKGANFFRVLFYVPAIIGGVVMSTMYRYLLDGGLSDIFYKLGWISDQRYQDGFFYGATSFKTIIVYSIWVGLVGNMLVISGALTRIPTEILESAKLDGVGFFREFFQIVFPLIWPTVASLFVFSMATMFTADGGTYLLTGLGNYEASTGGYYLFSYQMNIAQSGNVRGIYYPAAVALFMTCITLPITLTTRHLFEKYVDPIEY